VPTGGRRMGVSGEGPARGGWSGCVRAGRSGEVGGTGGNSDVEVSLECECGWSL
jgi:hypothetical protein